MSAMARRISACLRPRFLGVHPKSLARQGFFNYRWLWLLSIGLLAAVSLLPVIILAGIDYTLTGQAAKSEMVFRATGSVSNTRRTVTYFLDERLAVLEFTLREEGYSSLADPGRLAQVLKNLRAGFFGIVDLGLLHSDGRQVSYAGPFDLEGRSYKDVPWFQAAMRAGAYVSDVFAGFRDVPHVIVAVRGEDKSGGSFLLRATLDMEAFLSMLSSLKVGRKGDAFLMNPDGVLQTPSRVYGDMLQPAGIPVPEKDERTSHFMTTDVHGRQVLVAYAYIEASPFILCVVKPVSEAMSAWMEPRKDLLWLSGTSLVVILAAIYVISTYMTNAIYEANLRQAHVMERMEQTGRLASIGRLAAGVAHEINNPLAIISERAGLVRDMLAMPGQNADPRLLENIDIVLGSVDRCGTITKQLLGFASKIDLKVEDLDVGVLVRDVLRFLEKEAGYRGIDLEVDIPPDLPAIRADRGKMQQIMLNLVSNAFQAMSEGGKLTIAARLDEKKGVQIQVQDTGCGIPPKHLSRVFEPFFTTKGDREGSGLGLAITYGLIQKLGGSISVESQPGVGSVFTIILPRDTDGSHEKAESSSG